MSTNDRRRLMSGGKASVKINYIALAKSSFYGSNDGVNWFYLRSHNFDFSDGASNSSYSNNVSPICEFSDSIYFQFRKYFIRLDKTTGEIEYTSDFWNQFSSEIVDLSSDYYVVKIMHYFELDGSKYMVFSSWRFNNGLIIVRVNGLQLEKLPCSLSFNTNLIGSGGRLGLTYISEGLTIYGIRNVNYYAAVYGYDISASIRNGSSSFNRWLYFETNLKMFHYLNAGPCDGSNALATMSNNDYHSSISSIYVKDNIMYIPSVNESYDLGSVYTIDLETQDTNEFTNDDMTYSTADYRIVDIGSDILFYSDLGSRSNGSSLIKKSDNFSSLTYIMTSNKDISGSSYSPWYFTYPDRMWSMDGKVYGSKTKNGEYLDTYPLLYSTDGITFNSVTMEDPTACIYVAKKLTSEVDVVI